MNEPRIVILGAGPCGLGAAYRLKQHGYNNYAIYERNSYVGGLATSFADGKGFTWDFGVHVAHSHYTYIDRLMEELLPDGFYYHERRSWVRVYDSWVPYPFQYNFRHLPERARLDCLQGLEILQAGAAAGKPIRDFKTWILNTFGPGIAEHFMIPYNRKIWSIDLDQMGIQWLGDRVPQIDVQRVKRNIDESRDDVSWGPNHVFQFPKTGGTGSIWKAMAGKLPQDMVQLNTEAIKIDFQKKQITFSDGTQDTYDHLISTIPIPELVKIGEMSEICESAESLKYTHVYVVGVASRQPIPHDLSDKTWVYCPEDKASFYRVTPFSTFSPDHTPDGDEWCSLLCEVSMPGTSELLEAEVFSQSALAGLKSLGLMTCDPKDTHIYPMRTAYGYPVPTVDRDVHLQSIMSFLEKHQILSRGRFGGWKYEVANMDHSIMQGVEAVERLVEGKPETTWFDPSLANTRKI